MTWIDVHTHLNMLEVDVETALSRARAAGVEFMITIGTNPEDFPKVLSNARAHFPFVGGALGIHPHEAKDYSPEIERLLRQELPRPEMVALGEIGLDYHYDHSPRTKQVEAFRAQLAIARDLGLPVEIHTRDAEEETARVLADFAGDNRGLLHCFTGTWTLAERALACGYDISISGVVTFKNADDLRDVVRRVPIDRLHIETDAPFLAPIPHRGKKNEPAFVPHVAAVVAELKNVSPAELSEQLRANARRLFPKMPTH